MSLRIKIKLLSALKNSIQKEFEDFSALKKAEIFCKNRTKKLYEEMLEAFRESILNCQKLSMAVEKINFKDFPDYNTEKKYFTNFIKSLGMKQQILKKTRTLLKSCPALHDEFVFHDLWNTISEFKTRDPWFKQILSSFKNYFTSKDFLFIKLILIINF